MLAKYLPLYNDLLEKNGSGFYVGPHETYVDFWIAEYLFTLNQMVPELLKDYPNLLAHIKRIHNLPQLKSYISSRKQTPL